MFGFLLSGAHVADLGGSRGLAQGIAHELGEPGHQRRCQTDGLGGRGWLHPRPKGFSRVVVVVVGACEVFGVQSAADLLCVQTIGAGRVVLNASNKEGVWNRGLHV